ncbi:MAG TPA: hypothetical protein VMR50_04540 [Myxococcota bacterium]|nr:hypothetical protein [Myxococcota bacterium]
MWLPDSRLRIAVLVGLALALFAAAASRAATGTLFIQQPCGDMTTIPGQYGFENSFVGVTNCTSLCKQAVVVCQRAIKDAESCQLAFASDWVAFDSQVECADLTGNDLRDCKNSWSQDKKTWQATIKGGALQAVAQCAQHLSFCTFRCSGS